MNFDKIRVYVYNTWCLYTPLCVNVFEIKVQSSGSKYHTDKRNTEAGRTNEEVQSAFSSTFLLLFYVKLFFLIYVLYVKTCIHKIVIIFVSNINLIILFV